MPKLSGLDAPGVLHHVIGRGAEKVCNKYGIPIAELKSLSRRKDSIEARRMMAWVGMRGLRYS